MSKYTLNVDAGEILVHLVGGNLGSETVVVERYDNR
jgi:hypothetical protein